MKKFISLAVAFLTAIMATAKIHTIGDSTMADYDQSQPDQKGMYGWGQVFGDYLTGGMTTKNWGDRGESARSFYKKFWSKAKSEIKKGDYVLIQFGHNDQKSVTTDVYREYLAKFVKETRQLGATPVLVTSICRKLFDGTKISRLGRIDNGKAKGVSESDHSFDYPYNMKRVADSLKVVCLDITTATKEYLESWGPAGSKQFFPDNGSTHTNELGARVNAQLVAQLMYKANILKKYIATDKINIPQNDGTVKVTPDENTESDNAEEDWNYYMVKTGADGYAVFGNLSGENLIVPEGLIAYGVIPGTEKNQVKLVKVGNVIPAKVGVIVRGRANTEYSLTATSEPSQFKRQKQNLLVASVRTAALNKKDGGNFNYIFTSERKQITFVPADGKTQLRIKRAYLSCPVKVESLSIERRRVNTTDGSTINAKKKHSEKNNTTDNKTTSRQGKASSYFVSPSGNNNNDGTSQAKAFASLAAAQSKVMPGDTVFILPGTYKVKKSELMAPEHQKNYAVAFLLDKSGTPKRRISYIGVTDDKGNRPVFDFSAVKPSARITGFLLSAKYLTLKNIETIGIQVTQLNHTQSENFRIANGSHNILENIAAHDGMGIGFYLIGRCAGNYIINCDAYNNYDSVSEGGKGGNNDGFGCHPGSLDSDGNMFVGCRAWLNSDDGYDLINAQAPVTFAYCIAYKNGIGIVNGVEKKLADGNGFKCGGYGMGKTPKIKFEKAPMHLAEFCVSAFNRANGFYANHHLGGLHFSHCTAYKNGGASFNLTNRKDKSETGNVNVNGYGHIVEHCLSFGADAIKSNKHLTMADGDKADCTITDNSFHWNKETKKWDNNKSITTKNFGNLDAATLIAPRSADGMLPQISFMILNSTPDMGYNFNGYKTMVENLKNK